MQVNIKTKRGTVVLSFNKLRVFRRLNLLEDRMTAVEEKIKKLGAVAEGCPYKNRAKESVERPTPKRDADNAEPYTALDLYTEWTEGEDVAKQRREEREREAHRRAQERGGSGV